MAERSNATVLKTADGATRPGVRIPHHPPGISISSNLYEIDIKNPRVLWGFYYFADSGKPAIMAISAAFLGYLYPAQFCKVSEYYTLTIFTINTLLFGTNEYRLNLTSNLSGMFLLGRSIK